MLEVELGHTFGAFQLDVAFTAPTPGATVLFGPSGSGKSSVIAALAGLLRPQRARVVIDGVVLADTVTGRWTPAERRRLGVVFQDARLFPHLSVIGNLRYGLSRADPSTAGRRIAFDEVVDLLGIGGLLNRRPVSLSGGERQRVAIGRALLAQPRLLLMDEPIASLDGPRKAEILPFLARLKRLSLPMVYVTHATDELARLADTLVLIEDGRCIAAGPLSEVASRAELPLASRDDAASIVDADVEHHDLARGLTRLAAAGCALLVPLRGAPVGTHLRVRVPARDVILATSPPTGISVQNVLTGSVRAVVPIGRASALVEVAIGQIILLARLTADSVAALGLRPGHGVVALVKSVSVEVLGQEGGLDPSS